MIVLLSMSRLSAYRFSFAKYPAVRIALLLAVGIVLGAYTAVSLAFWLIGLGFILLIIVGAETLNKRGSKLFFFKIGVSFYLLAVILFGAAWYTLFEQKQHHSARLLSAFTWEEATFTGVAQKIDPSSGGGLMIDVMVETTVFQDSLAWRESFKMRAYLDSSSEAEIETGDRVKFIATLYPLEPVSNPGEFKYKQYLASQNIFVHAGIDSVLSVEVGNKRLSWNWLQRNVLQLIELNFNEETTALAKSVLIGYKNELSPETKTAFSRAGLAHIMAVSGMNVVYILAPFWLIIPFLWSFRFGRYLGLGLMIFILIVFAGLTGFTASVMRACIMGGFITYGRIFNRARNSKNLTAVAAIIILLINPADIFNVGFQLSFAAVYIILLVLPVVQRLIPDRIRYRWYGIPLMAALVTLVVQLGLYPILSFYFGEFSLIAPLANAVVVPLLGLVVPYALFLVILAGVLPSFAYILNAPCRLFLEFLQWFTSALSHLSWSWMQTPETGVMIFLIWLAAAFLISYLRVPKVRWKLLALFLSLLVIQQFISLGRSLQPATLKVTVLDVGQGDAAVLTTPNGKHYLIDAGRWSADYNSGSGVILPYLKAAGIDKLEAVFLSHPHADHIGGMPALIGRIPIGIIYNSGISYKSDLFKRYLREAAALNIPVHHLKAGDMIRLGPSVQLFVYGPAPGNHSSDVNNHSLVFEVIYGQTEFLFVGDAGEYQEGRLLKHYGALINTDFLKVGHHGSNTSSSVAFLQVVTPAVSVVSVAKNNRYGLPDPKPVRRLKQSGTRLYFTALSGALQFISNGHTIERLKWR